MEKDVNGDLEGTKKDYSAEWQKYKKENIHNLKKISASFKKVKKSSVYISNFVGGSTALLGAFVAVGGVVAAPFTGGVSLASPN